MVKGFSMVYAPMAVVDGALRREAGTDSNLKQQLTFILFKGRGRINLFFS